MLGAREEIAFEAVHLLMCLAQFCFYVVLTYQDAPLQANAGIITTSGVLLLYFSLYGLYRFLEAFRRGTLASHARSLETHCDLAATTALWLPFV